MVKRLIHSLCLLPDGFGWAGVAKFRWENATMVRNANLPLHRLAATSAQYQFDYSWHTGMYDCMLWSRDLVKDTATPVNASSRQSDVDVFLNQTRLFSTCQPCGRNVHNGPAHSVVVHPCWVGWRRLLSTVVGLL